MSTDNVLKRPIAPNSNIFTTEKHDIRVLSSTIEGNIVYVYTSQDTFLFAIGSEMHDTPLFTINKEGIILPHSTNLYLTNEHDESNIEILIYNSDIATVKPTVFTIIRKKQPLRKKS